jgi:hypothetical protein
MVSRLGIRFLSIALFAAPLSAATFTVTNTNDSGAGSLRQAILDANGNAGLDTIAFNITGSGLHTIQPLLSPIFITDAVVVDGFTQAGSSPNTLLVGNDAVYKVEIDGSGLTNDLFRLLTSGSTIRGLLINRVPGVSIQIDGGDDDNKLIGNWMGTDITGTQYLGGNTTIIRIGGSNNQLGGTAAADHNVLVGGGGAGSATVSLEVNGFNVIQGNLIGLNAAGTAVLSPIPPPSYGIAIGANAHDNLIGGTTAGARNVVFANADVVLGPGAHHNTFQGNYLGTDATGTVAMGSTVGIDTNNSPHDNVIGGAAPGAGNVISGNSVGIHFVDGAAANTVQGNFFGTDPSGLLAVPNTAYAIQIATPSAGSTIGGINPGEGNTIAFNGATGVLVSSSTGWAIRGNSIHDNAALGIDLQADSVNFNDPGDVDEGPNHLQNFPILKTVTIEGPQGGGTRIQGKLDSTAATTFDLDFYANAACSNFPREFLEGETYLGSTQVTTDGTGHADIDVTLSAAIQPGQKVSATATDPGGNTSEFSQRIIFSIDQGSGPSSGGAAPQIHGTDLSNPTTATFGGVAAPATFVDDHTLNTSTPALPPGTVNDVVVTTADGTTGTLVKGWVSDFLDVDSSHQFYSFVTKLVSNAITVGVGGGLYGVDQPTLRQQMAVFLLKARHGLCYVPPACHGDFNDVPCPSTFADWIEALADEGISGGCGNGNFCPTNPVRRDQMAPFLLKAEHGSSYVPPDCAGTFSDVPCPSLFADWIEQLAAESITGGCGVGTYCPGNVANRGQMATFVTKTFHLQ